MRDTRKRKINVVKVFANITLLVSIVVAFILMTTMIFEVNKLQSNLEGLENKIQSIHKESQLIHKEVKNQKEDLNQSIDKIESIGKKVDKISQNTITPSQVRNMRFSGDTDLSCNRTITATTINKIIDGWGYNTPFKGKGEVFAKAGRITGLNPIYILAHAAWESGWGTSYLAKNKGNYFGINAVDSNPNRAYYMGDSVDDGIIQGAIWIKKNYYDKGHNTLNKMVYNGNYASAKGEWVTGIKSIMNESCSLA